MSATIVGPETEPPRLAFAVNRSVGNAVERNRVRRRLRAATRSQRALMQPGWAYLVHAKPAARDATYRELETALTTALSAHSRKDGP